MLLKIFIWIITIVVLLLSTFFVIGLMVGDTSVPSLRGAGPQDAEERVPAGPAYEIPTFNRFMAAAFSGDMPGNVKTELPLFPATEMNHLNKPYNEWAPEPFSKLPGPQGMFGGTEVSPAPIIRIMHIMSGLDSIFEDAFSHVMSGGRKTPEALERSSKIIKTKVWFGIAPVSDARWKAKGLDEEANIEEALAIIQQTIDIFDYLRSPEVQGNIRHIFNKIWADIDVFQDACNAVRRSGGEAAPEWSLSKLWQEYNKFHFEFMEKQARAWTFQHLNTLYSIWKTRFISTFQSGQQLNSTQTTIKIDHYAMMIMNKMQDMYLDADLFIHARTDGFIMPHGIHPTLVNVNAPKADLNKAYAALEDQRIKFMRGSLRKVVEERVTLRRRNTPRPGFMEAPSMLVDREFGHKSVQPEIENPTARRIEPWAKDQTDEKVEKFGFVIYRLSYKESDDEWKDFLGNLEDGLESGWEGVIGAEQISGKSRLHWIDGREKDIPEGDLEAARNAFKTLKENPEFPTGLSTTFFLAITPQSLDSFLSIPTTPSDQQGDYRGFLHAVSAGFSPASPSDPSSSSQPKQREKQHTPGYDGTFKIIDQLVWTDLFAMTSMAAQDAEAYWALAAQHPWGVYVGPTTGVMRRMWREMNDVEGGLLEAEKAAAAGELR